MQVHFGSSHLRKGFLLNDRILLFSSLNFLHRDMLWLQLLLLILILLFLFWLGGGLLGFVLGLFPLSTLRWFIFLALGSRQLTPLEAVHLDAVGLLLIEGHVDSQLFGRHFITRSICF